MHTNTGRERRAERRMMAGGWLQWLVLLFELLKDDAIYRLLNDVPCTGVDS